MTVLNHYSYAIAGALLIVAVGAWAFERRSRRALALLVLVAIAIVAVDLLFRPGDPSVASAAEFERAIASGRPALVEFYSNY